MCELKEGQKCCMEPKEGETDTKKQSCWCIKKAQLVGDPITETYKNHR
jgi:hypothetical protein